MRTTLFLASHLLLTGIASAGSGGLFTENKGQWPAHVFFRTAFSQHAVFVERNAFTVVAWSGDHAHGTATPAGKMQRHAYHVRFLGADGTQPVGSGPVPGLENFFLGNDPAKWGTNAHRYQELGSTDLYPGIDLCLKADGSFKYELLVHPGASPDLIAIGYEGQDELRLQGGELLIGTSAGTMVEQAPVAYQERDGVRIPIACAYELQGDRLRYSFPEGYDPTLALVIDPALIFSTYSGSTADNFGAAATYDDSGHLYSGSLVFYAGYPTTLGSYQATFAAVVDIAISKFALDGSALIWSTYLGGAGSDCPLSLAVSTQDELFLLGVTSSDDFPTTPEALDTSFNGGPQVSITGMGMIFVEGADLALVKLGPNGDTLLGGSYLGGTGTDGVNLATDLCYNYNDRLRSELVLDNAGRPLLATTTTSTDMPTTANAPQAALAGHQDAYIARLGTSLDTLEWATYFGGSLDDAGYALCLNSQEQVIVAGGTESAVLPLDGPFDGTFGGVADGFVARYSASGDELFSSTFLGTAQYDQAFFVAVDASDAVIVLGQTAGVYPVTPGTYANPGSTNFLQKLSPDLGTGEWSTVIGNGSWVTDISAVAFGIDYGGRLLLCGFGSDIGVLAPGTTNGLPVTPDAYQTTTDGNDFYIAALAPEAESLVYATFLGGPISREHIDGGMSRFNPNGDLFLAVCAGCFGNNDFPTTPGAWSPLNNSINCNLAAVKFSLDASTATPEQTVPGEALVWPTPADALIQIGGCDDPPCELVITDATGRVVARAGATAASAVLSVEAFAPGMYQVRIGEGSRWKCARFIVR